MLHNLRRKINIVAFTLFLFVIIAVVPFYTREYDDLHRISRKMYELGYIPSLSETASDEEIFDWITGYATYEDSLSMALSISGVSFSSEGEKDYTTAIPYLRSDMTSGFTENGVFVFPDNMVSSFSGENFSKAGVYELAMRLLGYNSSDFGTTTESVISFALGKKFGFVTLCSDKTDFTRGEMAAVFYETLFLPVRSSGYSLTRLLSITVPGAKDRFLDMGMLDDFPDFVPFYVLSPYKDESFTFISSQEGLKTEKKSEWFADYMMADEDCYNSYKVVLSNDGWSLDTEYTRDNASLSETCALFYKDFSGTEKYILVRYNKDQRLISLWSAF